MNSICIDSPYKSKCYKITTNSDKIVEILGCIYKNFLSCDNKKEQFLIRVIELGLKYEIQYDNKSIFTDSPIVAIKRIFFNYPFYLSNIIALHGAALEYNNKAYLFLGETGSGKSTLTMFLVQNKLGYITDDTILIDKESKCVLPQTLPIQLRDGGVDVLKSINIAPENYLRINDFNYSRYLYTPDKIVNKELEIHEIYLIERSDEDKTIILNDYNSFIKLIYSSLSNYDFDFEYLNSLNAISKITFKKIKYKNMKYVLSNIYRTDNLL